MPFQGFTENTFKYLIELGFNNNREWYQEHKEDYQAHVLKPFRELVESLGQKMLAVDKGFQITPVVDKTISRIYRDTRFSKDKTPYRSNVWITFKRDVPDWQETPSFFFGIYPDYYHFGMGFFVFPAETREKLRAMILENPDQLKKIIRSYSQDDCFQLGGDRYKRTKDKDVPDELRQWYERKSLYLYCRKSIDDLLFSSELADFLYQKFFSMKPLYDYLWKARS